MAAILPVAPPPKLTPRADFNELELRKFFFNHSIRVQWEQAAICPCGQVVTESAFGIELPSTNSNQRRVDCTLCRGTGYFHHSAQEIKAFILSFSANNELFSRFGMEVERGSVSVTTLPEHLLSRLDRLTALDMVMVVQDVDTRRGALSPLRHTIAPRTLGLVGGTQTVSVLQARSAKLDGLPLADMTLGVDYTIDANNNIVWALGDVTGKAPPVGARYSISYYARPRFIVQDHPYVARDAIVQVKSPTAKAVAYMVKASARLDTGDLLL